MREIKKHITLVFLIIFTLVKVNPLYYGLQLYPSSSAKNIITVLKVGGYAGAVNFVKVEKAIYSETDRFSIPFIVCSGMIFELFLAGTILSLTGLLALRQNHFYLFHSKPIYIIHSVFRL